jgi:hypothetical protein
MFFSSFCQGDQSDGDSLEARASRAFPNIKEGGYGGLGVHQASIQRHSPSIQHPLNIHQTSIKHPHTSTILTGANRIFSGFAG